MTFAQVRKAIKESKHLYATIRVNGDTRVTIRLTKKQARAIISGTPFDEPVSCFVAGDLCYIGEI